jgi:hypothetical protein
MSGNCVNPRSARYNAPVVIRAPRATIFASLLLFLSFGPSLQAQDRRLWVVQPPAVVVEYDPLTFAKKDSRPVPAEVPNAPQVLQINHQGQMLFAPSVDDPSPDVGKGTMTFWFWDGRSELKLGRDAIRTSSKVGSNQKVTESNPLPFLSADGTHLFWFSNQFVKLQRDNIDLSVTTSVTVWRSDLAGRQREDLASSELPECRCTTGSCQETCPEAAFWTPDCGVDNFFLLTQFVPGQTEVKYLASSVYKGSGDTWTASPLPQPLHRVLDAADGGSVIIDAIPDIGCCGWENQSNDQTLLFSYGKKLVLFDEREQFNNPDYDVSFFTSNARLSPQLTSVAMTVVASAKSNLPIQLSEDGQGNPAESQRIRKALTQLPEVQVVSATDPSKRTALLPHATLIGWLSEKEILIVENHVLIAYNLASGARRKSEIKIEDPSSVFIR